MTWPQCQADWLSQIARRSGGTNTRRAYEADMHEFFAFTGRQPDEITAAHAEAWAQALAGRGLAPATINRKLASLASFYRYAATYPGLTPSANPFSAPGLRSHHPPAPIDFPTPEQIEDLLAQIPVDTATGLRNYAIIAGMVVTTRRINEWINLRAGAITHAASTIHWFTYRTKGGDQREQQLPHPIWQVIHAYLIAAGRWPLQPDDYIFVALSPNGARLRTTGQDAKPLTRPLNPGYIARLIMRYGQAAGIPAGRLYPHALRHAGAEIRWQERPDLVDLQRILGHKNPATTVAYLRRIDRPQDPLADTIGRRLTRRLSARGAITPVIAPDIQRANVQPANADDLPGA